MNTAASAADNLVVMNKLIELYEDAFSHDGFAELKVEIRLLRRGQKEVIVSCGKQHRFVVDCPAGRRTVRAGYRVVTPASTSMG